MTQTWTLLLRSTGLNAPVTVLPGYLSQDEAIYAGDCALADTRGHFVDFNVIPGPPIMPPLIVGGGGHDSLLRPKPLPVDLDRAR